MTQFSTYQRAVFDDIAHGHGNTLVEAGPGSGKTFTLVEAAARLPYAVSLAFLAFNRSTVDELRTRITRRATIQTVHSLGFGVLRKQLRRVKGGKMEPYALKVDGTKTQQLMERCIDADARNEFGGLLKRAVSLAKAHAIAPGDENAWRELLDRFDLDVAAGDADAFIPLAARLLSMSDNCFDVIDHDDMIRLPVQRNLRFPSFDWIFLDEAQDISVAQRLLIARLQKPATRLLAVGDPRQSLYAFRGASHTSMDELKQHFHCKVLPLSISYRCPRNVIDYARRIYPDVEPAPGAIDGAVYSLPHWQPGDFEAGDMILCRNNAPLVTMLYALLERGISARLLGTDTLTTLTRIVKKVAKDDFLPAEATPLARLIAWRRTQVNRFKRAGKLDKVAAVEDHVQVLLTVAKHAAATSTDAIIAALRKLFDHRGAVSLSTIHRAKGLEADRVFILDPDLMPSRYATQDWQLVQEKNLEYVAVTRARRELIFIRSAAQSAELDDAVGW